MFIWTYTGEVNSKRIREHYFKAVLRQDIAFFDTLGAGEVATRIQTDTHLIQQGISEKVGSEYLISIKELATDLRVIVVASYLGAFVTGFVLAYIKSWRAALVLSCILPCIFVGIPTMSYLALADSLALDYRYAHGQVRAKIQAALYHFRG